MNRLSVCACLLSLALCRHGMAAEELFPKELVSFKAAAQNPVFTARGDSHWDVKIRERGWILFDSQNGKSDAPWKMWFTGYDGTREGRKKLGYAWSKDGLHWTREPSNPIVSDYWVEDMMVVKHDGVFHMFAEGKGDLAQRLTSKDGVKWTRVGSLDVRKKNGEPIEPGPYGTPTAWVEDGVWSLFYERRDLGIWLAQSKDMKVWRNVQDEPVLSPGPGRYDLDLVALNQIVKHKGRYYAYYHGSKRGSKLWSTGVAVSRDLIHWKKFAGNPLMPVQENKSSGILVHDGRGFRLYTMHDQVHVHFSNK